MNQHTSIIIVGVTGDLAKKKLIPALYHLYSRKVFDTISVIGVGHQYTDMQTVLTAAKPYVHDIDDHLWNLFGQHCFFVQADITDQLQVEQLVKLVELKETQFTMVSCRMIYFAVAPTFFAPATELFWQVKLFKKIASTKPYWHRIVYEKPFGHDLQSAHQINVLLKQYVYEEQVFRIDHYLTKDVVTNISLLRFSNMVFEPLWNSLYIDQVQVVLHESIGIESRGHYYDAYGVVKDVIQNHVMQMIALIAMEKPQQFENQSIRDERARVLKTIQFVDGLYGQYAGYTSEIAVPFESVTPTYALLKFQIDSNRWQGVPFFVSAGKKMAQTEVAIHIKFKPSVLPLIKQQGHVESNWLTIQLSPDAVFSLRLNVQSVSKPDELVSAEMVFCHSCVFGTRPSQAYETLLDDICKGRIESTVRNDEIESAWQLVDSIQKAQLPLFVYPMASEGPEDAIDSFRKKYGMSYWPGSSTVKQ